MLQERHGDVVEITTEVDHKTRVTGTYAVIVMTAERVATITTAAAVANTGADATAKIEEHKRLA